MNSKLQKFKFSDKLLSSVKILYPNALVHDFSFENCSLLHYKKTIQPMPIFFTIHKPAIKGKLVIFNGELHINDHLYNMERITC